jgi:hypothetical protein
VAKAPKKDLSGAIFLPGDRSSNKTVENFNGSGLNVVYLDPLDRNKNWTFFAEAAKKIEKSNYKFAFIAFEEISIRELNYLSKIASDYKDLNGLTFIQVSPRLRKALLLQTTQNYRSWLNAINLLTNLKIKKNIKAFIYGIVRGFYQIYSRTSGKEINIGLLNPLNDQRAQLLRKHAETSFLGDIEVVVISADAIQRVLAFRNQDLLDSQGILAGISRAGYFKSFVRF